MTATEAEIIKVLAEEKNMRKAAERLFLTQPALSQRLQSIEKEWGSQLFISKQKAASYCRIMLYYFIMYCLECRLT